MHEPKCTHKHLHTYKLYITLAPFHAYLIKPARGPRRQPLHIIHQPAFFGRHVLLFERLLHVGAPREAELDEKAFDGAEESHFAAEEAWVSSGHVVRWRGRKGRARMHVCGGGVGSREG